MTFDPKKMTNEEKTDVTLSFFDVLLRNSVPCLAPGMGLALEKVLAGLEKITLDESEDEAVKVLFREYKNSVQVVASTAVMHQKLLLALLAKGKVTIVEANENGEPIPSPEDNIN